MDIVLSTSASKFNLRRYAEANLAAAATKMRAAAGKAAAADDNEEDFEGEADENLGENLLKTLQESLIEEAESSESHWECGVGRAVQADSIKTRVEMMKAPMVSALETRIS